MSGSTSKKKTLKFVFFFLFIILLVAGFGSYAFVKSRVPQMSGELDLKGLSAKVYVRRDKNGIPHIEAQNNADAFRALGFVMASERLFQMEMGRRVSQGELAEVFGEKALKSDKLYRNLGLKKHSQKIIDRKTADKTYPLEMLAEAEAFYDGINQFIATKPLPLEMTLLGIKPRPFEVIDGMAFMGLMGFSFGTAIMMEPLLTDLVKRIGGDLVEELRNEKNPAASTAVVDIGRNFLTKKTLEVIADLERGFTLFEGSNGWVLSGKHSTSGAPVLANDPHISYTLPGVWFEAHVKTPTYENYGHYLSMVPFPVLAHNRDRGWGLTMSLVDDMDIYREKIDEKNKTYLFKGKALPLIAREEVIKVKGADDYKMMVFETQHGPVLETSHEKSLSLQWAFYDEANDPFSTLFGMGRSKTMAEFKAAVATGKAPGLNILYADKQNIGWWIFGDMWLKRPALRRDFVLNGDTGEDEITGVVAFEKKPHLENPVSGIIVSANSKPLGYPKDMRGDWQPEDRFKTIEAALLQKEKWSPEETMELQSLSMNFENKRLIETLIRDTSFKNENESKNYQKYFEILRKWNLSSDVGETAPSIYYSWTFELQLRLLENFTEDEKESWGRAPNSWIFFKRVILDPQSVWWKRYDRGTFFRESLVAAIESLEKKFGNDTANWQWGGLHTLEFVHPLGRIKPLNLIFNLGPYAISGATNEVNNQKTTSFKDKFQVKAGPSTRRVIDFANPEKSWGILPLGNSGNILSPFYKDQVKLFLSGQYREQLMDPEAHDILYDLTLNPVY